MLSRERLLKIRVRGLWSTATSRLGEPRMNFRHWFNPYVRASASPSTGAYLLSAGFVNRKPASTRRQCPLPQFGDHVFVSCCFGHSQYFCVSVNPTPTFDQSVLKHVTRSCPQRHLGDAQSLAVAVN